MYKTLSTALHIPASRLVISMAACTVLGFVVYHNWMDMSIPGTDEMMRLPLVFLLVASLTFFNIYCESQKWRQLVSSELVGIKAAYTQVVAGLCSGFLTPNRVGEFAGRRYMMPHGEKHKAFLVTLAGSGLQGGVTALFGLVGLIYFPLRPVQGGYAFSDWTYLGLGAFGLLIFIYVLYKKPNNYQGLLRSLAHLRELPGANILSAGFWAVLRYVIFSTQFVLALLLLGFNGEVAMCYAGVFLLYFCQSYIPGAAFGELGVRELLAVVIFGPWMPNPLLAALAGFIVWAANIGLPVLIGSALYGLRLKRSL